ncbi:prion-inhibition and propagation-domain-containing protein [Xylaria bambusicola]|uniref:prion-inhibition and propagation-domain-containing protein n=1 Tax=Xylaria bambusicola TaxID=326684 RepID=UPI0020083602|nr:prion-inhibition and propagation-domain-containing protein [Xylaria bambusicola]KAI0513163.1 prion-inhibition and propagation-domain-containing protein [Xylaria bambusicola]
MEAFGTATSVLSVASLFNNCVIWFEYIQLGRHFARDYERCQLKLDIAKTRLSRWGEAVKINEDQRFATHEPFDTTCQQVQAILEEIDQLFGTLQKSSKRYVIGAKPEDLELCQVQDMRPMAQKLHNRLHKVVSQRQKRTGFFKKAAWALYDAKNFDKLLGQITGFIDDLEKLFPAEPARHTLVEMEIEEIKEDEPSLQAVQDAANDIDPAMSEVVADRLKILGGHNSASDVQAEETARVLIGNGWTDAALANIGVGVSEPTQNRADKVIARGSSSVMIGNNHGGRGFWDSR